MVLKKSILKSRKRTLLKETKALIEHGFIELLDSKMLFWGSRVALLKIISWRSLSKQTPYPELNASRQERKEAVLRKDINLYESAKLHQRGVTQ